MVTTTTKTPSTRSQSIFFRVVIEGRSLEQTATEFKTSRHAVECTLRIVRRWLRRGKPWLTLVSAAKSSKQLHMLHFARLEHLWCEAMSAWYQSKLPAEIDKAVIDDKKQGKAEKSRHSQTGDVKYLIQARAILLEIRELLGRHVPARAKETDHVERLNLEQRTTRLAELLGVQPVGAAATPDLAVHHGPIAGEDAA